MDEDVKPMEWVNKYKKREGHHAMCPIYKDKKYFWTKCKVLKYDPMKDRYLVNIIENASDKWIVRLSLKFNDEDQDKFKERVELSKMR